MVFVDRVHAGRRLASRLEHLRGQPLVVLGLPRGGVPVAFEVAEALDAPLDVIVVRKLGVPFQPELGMGAIGEDGARVINRDIVHRARMSDRELAEVEARERVELERRASRFRGGQRRIPLEGRVALVVDDGVATGSTARAACQVARAHGAARVILAVPVAPPDWIEHMAGAADEYIALDTPSGFYAVGQYYASFSQTSDDEVVSCLRRAAQRRRNDGNRDDPPSIDADVTVQLGALQLGGHLTIPDHAAGVVVFAHGSGSSRHSPRNRSVAEVLHRAGLGTLLFDLLTPEEEHQRDNVFDIELLAGRLVDATRWLRARAGLSRLPVGYFGASTGAAAALWAAAELDADVGAVVSRGGRPDLAGPRLHEVRSPTLLIVGGDDEMVVELNRDAAAHLRCEHRLVVIRGATHLFEEPGTLQAAATAARDWFIDHLSAVRGDATSAGTGG